jgi:hypothetical protein
MYQSSSDFFFDESSSSEIGRIRKIQEWRRKIDSAFDGDAFLSFDAFRREGGKYLLMLYMIVACFLLVNFG